MNCCVCKKDSENNEICTRCAAIVWPTRASNVTYLCRRATAPAAGHTR